MAVSPVSAASSSGAAFGLDFQSLLKIVLTQLTYQDPLKPLDNFQFVSQLAQFSQLQQSQTLNDQITSLLSSQSTLQATGLLGRTVDFTDASGAAEQTGIVKAVSFSSGSPAITVTTTAGDTLTGIALSNISTVR